MDTATVEQPPVTSTETPSIAAPATGAPSQPSAASTPSRPASFKDALIQADKAAEGQPAKPEGPTTLAAGDPNAKPGDQIGEPNKFHTQLENARQKAVAARDEQWREKVGWALNVPQESFQQIASLAQRISTAPATVILDILNDQALMQQHGPAIKAALAQFTGTGSAADAEPEPDVQIVGADGQIQGVTYSAAQLAKRDAWRERNLLAKVDQQYKPLMTERQERLTREQQAAERANNEKTADAIIARINRTLHVTKDTPKERIAELHAKVDALMARGYDAHDAALEVRDQVVLPTLTHTAEQKAADTMKQKAAGNTADGRASSASPPTRPQTTKELADFLRRLDGVAS